MEALEIGRRPVVLFDFDGTVADTGRAVMTSTRKTLAARGFSEAQMGDLRRMIGPPLWKSFHDFYGFSREESLVVADEYRAFFDVLGPEEYPVFDGIPELLDGLTARGKRMAVATSRMEAKCIDMVRELGLSQFEAVVGMNPPLGRETKADSVRDALAALGATADDPAVKALIDTYKEFTGKHAEPFAMGGGTYARTFASAVSFGPEETGLELPAWGGQMHGPNECANEEQLKQALKIYIVAILRLNELEL